MMKSINLITVIAFTFILTVSVYGAKDEMKEDDMLEPESLRDAGIVVSAKLLGAAPGPYGVSEDVRPTPLLYEGEPARFFVVISHRGFSEVELFQEDGDLKKQIAVSIQHDGKQEDTEFEAVVKPYRMDSRGREAKGFHVMAQGDSVQSAWELKSELVPGEYQLTISFAVAGKYEGKEGWKRDLRPIKFSVKKAESEEDKLNVLVRKAILLLDEEKPDEAIAELEKLLEEHPNSIFAYEYLGHCYLKKKDSEKAVESYEKAIEIAKNEKDEKMSFSGIEKSECLAYFENLVARALQME